MWGGKGCARYGEVFVQKGITTIHMLSHTPQADMVVMLAEVVYMFPVC